MIQKASTKTEITLNPGERIDDLERDGYRIIQGEKGFCFGMDAVLLSGFVRAEAGETLVDLGTGTGIIPILLASKTDASRLVGIEIDERQADMASRSIALNGLDDRVEIVRADLRALLNGLPGEDAARLGPLRGVTDVVTANPPYVREGSGLINPDYALSRSRHELTCTLNEVCAAAAKLLRQGGRFYMVHRPWRITEIINCLSGLKLEPKRLRMVYPRIDNGANMMLIEAVKGAGPDCMTEKPLIVYESPGKYSAEVLQIYGR